MKLLTPHLADRLTANGRASGDHAPVVKFFNPLGAGTWLFSEIDGDILFGLCDLGFGCAELGSASLSEIEALRLPFGLPSSAICFLKGASRSRSMPRRRAPEALSPKISPCLKPPPRGLLRSGPNFRRPSLRAAVDPARGSAPAQAYRSRSQSPLFCTGGGATHQAKWSK